MRRFLRVAVPVAVLAAAATMILLRESGRDSAPAVPARPESGARLPKLLDLGADKCIPCKKMAPILRDLAEEYRGLLEVEFIDVWRDRSAGEKYGIRLIPTQILYSADGREIFRHEGFWGKAEIIGAFVRHGIEFKEK